MKHLDHLQKIADEDVAHLLEKEKTYGSSWMKRGGVGAFMMLARKWDRLENMLSQPYGVVGNSGTSGKWDVLRALEVQDSTGPDGSVLSEVRDLRRYLLLVESWLAARTSEQRSTEEDPSRRPTTLTIDKSARVDNIDLRSIVGAYLPGDKITVVDPIQTYTEQNPLEHRVPRHTSWVGKRVEWEATQFGEKKILRGVVQKEYVSHLSIAENGQNHPANLWTMSKSEVRLAPVEATDSNRHSDRNVGHRLADGTWKVLPWISAETWTNIDDPELRERYVRVGAYYHVNRMLFDERQRSESFSILSNTLSRSDYALLQPCYRDFYEPRPGVDGEHQLRAEFREGWGQ